MDVIHNINEHTLTHIGPSKYGEDGIGVYASTQIKAGTLLFQLPEGFSVDTVEVSGEEIKKYIYSPSALDFLIRIIPHSDESFGKSTRTPTDDELIYSLPANGPNCVGLSSYIGHANEDQSYNVKMSNTLDSSGYLAMETTRVVEKGEELLVQYDKDQDHMLKYHHAFIKSAINALQGPNASANKETIKKNVNEIEDEQKKHLIENFNEFYLKLAVSSIHGVGVVVADHPGAVIQPGENPFNLPKGYSGYETIDLTQQQLDQLITSPAGKDFILKYCNPSKNDKGSMTYPVPTCGANGIDLSYFVNSATGTGRSCNLVLGEGRDARGLTPLVFTAIEGIDWNNKNPFLHLLAAVLEAVGLRFILQEAIAKAKKVIV